MKQSILGPHAWVWGGTQYVPVLTTKETGGAISITESISPPSSGPPRHIHHDADEIFYLITGDCEFWMDGKSMSRGPGDSVFIPRGAEHAFRVISDIPCRMLTVFTPGGFEGFFGEMARKGLRIPNDMDVIKDIAGQYHLTFTGPPLAA